MNLMRRTKLSNPQESHTVASASDETTGRTHPRRLSVANQILADFFRKTIVEQDLERIATAFAPYRK